MGKNSRKNRVTQAAINFGNIRGEIVNLATLLGLRETDLFFAFDAHLPNSAYTPEKIASDVENLSVQLQSYQHEQQIIGRNSIEIYSRALARQREKFLQELDKLRCRLNNERDTYSRRIDDLLSHVGAKPRGKISSDEFHDDSYDAEETARLLERSYANMPADR